MDYYSISVSRHWQDSDWSHQRVDYIYGWRARLIAWIAAVLK